MSTFSEEEKLQILADMVEIRTENDNEIEVCQYLQSYYQSMTLIQIF